MATGRVYLVRKQAGYPMGRALSHIGCNMAAHRGAASGRRSPQRRTTHPGGKPAPALAPRQVPLALDAHADTEPLAALSPVVGAAMLAGSTGSIPDQGVP